MNDLSHIHSQGKSVTQSLYSVPRVFAGDQGGAASFPADSISVQENREGDRPGQRLRAASRLLLHGGDVYNSQEPGVFPRPGAVRPGSVLAREQPRQTSIRLHPFRRRASDVRGLQVWGHGSQDDVVYHPEAIPCRSGSWRHQRTCQQLGVRSRAETRQRF